MTTQEAIKKRFPKSEFFTKDPRDIRETYLDTWDRTHDWFPFVTKGAVTVWCDVGYGWYALEIAGELVEVGKTTIVAGGVVFLSECESPTGKPVLAAIM